MAGNVFKGNTSTSALSTSYDIICRIKSFSVVNKSASTASVTISILYGSTNTAISPVNLPLTATGSVGSAYTSGGDIILLPGYRIYVLTNQSIDYFFSLE